MRRIVFAYLTQACIYFTGYGKAEHATYCTLMIFYSLFIHTDMGTFLLEWKNRCGFGSGIQKNVHMDPNPRGLRLK